MRPHRTNHYRNTYAPAGGPVIPPGYGPGAEATSDIPVTGRVPIHLAEILLFLYISTMLLALSAPQYNAISNVFGMFVGVACFVEFIIVRRRATPLIMVLPLVGLSLFVLMTTTSLFYLPGSAIQVSRHVQVFVLLGLVFYTIRTTGRMSSIFWGFSVGILLLFPIVMTQVGIIQQVDPEARLFLDVSGGEGGLNPNGYGIILNITILLAVYEIYANRKRRKIFTKSVIFGVGAAASCVAVYQIVFFLGSRQNQLWLLLTVIGFGFILTRGRLSPGRILIAGLATSILLGITIYLFAGSAHLERMLSPIGFLLHGDELRRSDYSRLNMKIVGLEMFLKSPIWGYGLEGYRLHSGIGGYSHDMFIETLVNYGLLGFCLFFSYYFLVLKRSWELFRMRIPGLGVVALWIFVCFVGIAASHLFRPVPYDKAMHTFLGALGGLVYYYYDRFGPRRARR